ncbi:MarR family winged helix-turn-helix transcriptional regulator [Desulfofalx alkaliphila]|uniref:MarR family winged helix-turn-helix transcriptional regulator n=1 Tax=Desulfofalx alkaliphila TaxID=105483 RepID=UPI0004E0E89B|nr:MarR family transcriptional regulator [Desulfofalx alkaliphila]
MKEEPVTGLKKKSGRAKKIPPLNSEAMWSLIKHYPCKNDKISDRLRILMYLRRLYHYLDVSWEKQLSAFNLTPAQHLALLTVIAAEGLSMTDLAALCLWNRSTASRISRSLQKKELISITPVDGKTSALKATHKGQELAALYLAKEQGEFEHGLSIIAQEAYENRDVYQWLNKSTGLLVGTDVSAYVENICSNVRTANSTEQPLQSQVYLNDPSDS